MVKHVIIWTLKDEYSAEEKQAIKQGISRGLRRSSRPCRSCEWEGAPVHRTEKLLRLRSLRVDIYCPIGYNRFVPSVQIFKESEVTIMFAAKLQSGIEYGMVTSVCVF